jgi:hypothetical protein
MKRISTIVLAILLGILAAACSAPVANPLVATPEPVMFEGKPPEVNESIMFLVFSNSDQRPEQREAFDLSLEAKHRKESALTLPPWCSATEAALIDNMQHVKYFVEVEGASYDIWEDFGWDKFEAADRYCAIPDGYLLFNGAGNYQVTLTIRLDADIHDGWEDYQAGDRVFLLDLEVQ